MPQTECKFLLPEIIYLKNIISLRFFYELLWSVWHPAQVRHRLQPHCGLPALDVKRSQPSGTHIEIIITEHDFLCGFYFQVRYRSQEVPVSVLEDWLRGFCGGSLVKLLYDLGEYLSILWTRELNKSWVKILIVLHFCWGFPDQVGPLKLCKFFFFFNLGCKISVPYLSILGSVLTLTSLSTYFFSRHFRFIFLVGLQVFQTI